MDEFNQRLAVDTVFDVGIYYRLLEKIAQNGFAMSQQTVGAF